MASLRVPDVVAAPSQDAQRINNAFSGWGTDEEGLVWVLGHRNASQRKQIRNAYQQLYNTSLFDTIHSELSGHFRKAMKLWIYDPPERDAKLIKSALKKQEKGCKLLAIVEIACASSPHHLITVRRAYCSLFDCSLEEDIASRVSLPLGKLLVGLVTSYRYNKESVDLNVADLEAAKLHEAIDTKNLDQDHFVWILSTRNIFQLRATFERYEQSYGSPIYEDVKTCGDGDLETIVSAVMRSIESPEKYFAEALRESFQGIGTDENSLTRVIVSRAEVDMKTIRGEYMNMYETSLDSSITDELSGDYKEFLLTLLGVKF